MGMLRWSAAAACACAVLGVGGANAAVQGPPESEPTAGELRDLRTPTSRTVRKVDGTFVTRIRAASNTGAASKSLVPSQPVVAQDCFVASGSSADERHCDEDTFQVGWDGTRARRALLSFDLSGVPRQWEVLDAILYLNGTATSRAGIGVHTLSAPWGATGPTWNNANATTPWSNAGGDFAAEPEAVVDVFGTRTTPFGVTQAVHDWIENGDPNNGFLVKQHDETANNVVDFVSSEGDPDLQPELVVITTRRLGEQRHYTFERFPSSPHRQLGVNVANGNLLIRESDVEFFDTDADYSLDRIYNSGGQVALNDFGTGWHSNFNRSIALSGYGSRGRWVTNATGATKSYLAVGEPRSLDGYEPVGVSDLVLDRVPDWTNDRYWTTTDPETLRQHEFDDVGHPTAAVDARGGRVRFSSSAPSWMTDTIEDGLGRVTRIARGPTSANRHSPLSLTDPAGGVRRYNYHVDARTLTSTVAPDGGITSYAYRDEYNELVHITDPDGSETHISYEHDVWGEPRVRTVTTDPVGGSPETTTYAYGDGVTTSTDAAGRQLTYWFDGSFRVFRTAGGPQPPSITLSGPLWDESGTVLAEGEHELRFSASDSAGITEFRIDVDGRPEETLPRDCEIACPVTATGSWTLDTADWLPGTRAFSITAVDRDGSTATSSVAVTIPEPAPFSDGTIPDEDPAPPGDDTPITTDACEAEYGAGSHYCIDPAPVQEQLSALSDGVAPFSRSTTELIYGISQDGRHSVDFPTYESFTALRVRRVRRIVSYNLMEQERPGGDRKFPAQIQEFRDFYEAAIDARLDIMVSFQFRLRKDRNGNVIGFEDASGPDRGYGPDSNYNYVPTEANYRNNVRAFKRKFPRVNTFSAWNEPNFRFQPTRAAKAGPARAALYTFLLAKHVCHPGNRCMVVASDAAGGRGTSWKRYLAAYTRSLKERFAAARGSAGPLPIIWGFHPYGDVQREPDPRKRQTSTDTFIDFAPAGSRIWLTEAGSRVDTSGNDGARLNSPRSQAREVEYFVRDLATSRASIAPVYYYSFCAPPTFGEDGLATHDSGLVGIFARNTSQNPGPCASQTRRPAWHMYENYTRQNPWG